MLLALRDRARGEVNHVVQAIQEEVNVNANTSAAPVHMADIATEAVDADVQVLQNERSILDDINAALARFDEGNFGECTHCGHTISEERLKAIPYASTCVECARSQSHRDY
jgi:RNA polymerase-binding transcription factor DksA